MVHERHGIGNFIEMVSRPVAGVSSKHGETPLKEYLVIEYAPSKRGGAPDRLFVPSDQLDLISHYVGSETPTLSKMAGATGLRQRAAHVKQLKKSPLTW